MKTQPMDIPLPQLMATVEDDPHRPNGITGVWSTVDRPLFSGHESIEPEKAMMSIRILIKVLDHFHLAYLQN